MWAEPITSNDRRRQKAIIQNDIKYAKQKVMSNKELIELAKKHDIDLKDLFYFVYESLFPTKFMKQYTPETFAKMYSKVEGHPYELGLKVAEYTQSLFINCDDL